MKYYLQHTGIPVNFGTTVLLAFLVGCAIAGQTFYLFTVENLKQFGTLKAMGHERPARRRHDPDAGAGGRRRSATAWASGWRRVYGIVAQRAMPLLAFFLPWQVVAISGAAVLVIALLSSLLSIRRVLVLEPAAVFQGAT